MINCFRYIQGYRSQTTIGMSGVSGRSLSRGPLQTFGGPPSKAYYECKICKKVITRDRIRDHHATYVDIDTLKKPTGNRLFSLSRLSAEKRKHTEVGKPIPVGNCFPVGKRFPVGKCFPVGKRFQVGKRFPVGKVFLNI